MLLGFFQILLPLFLQVLVDDALERRLVNLGAAHLVLQSLQHQLLDHLHFHWIVLSLACSLPAEQTPCRRETPYPIAQSARSRRSGGMTMSSARAVARLMAKANLAGRSIGSSPGAAPLKMRST